jgi:DNA-binding transcriptional LysR family regulator
MSPAHALARRNALTFADTLDQATISIGPGGQLDGLLRRQAALLGRLPAHRMQVAGLEAACRMIAAGLGMAILPHEAAVPYAGAGRLALVRLDEPWAVRRFVLIARATPASPGTAGLLAEHLAQAAAQPRR